jgi:RIO-like serine/threonine protein kinase
MVSVLGNLVLKHSVFFGCKNALHQGLTVHCLQIQVDDAGELYSKLMNLLLKFANNGVIHGDFNEFNIMITDDGEPIIIDFPQVHRSCNAIVHLGTGASFT